MAPNILHTNSENVRNNQIHLLMEKLLQLQKNQMPKQTLNPPVLVHELLNELIPWQNTKWTLADSEIPEYILDVKKLFTRIIARALPWRDLGKQLPI